MNQPAPTSAPTEQDRDRATVLDMINKARNEKGLLPLTDKVFTDDGGNEAVLLPLSALAAALQAERARTRAEEWKALDGARCALADIAGSKDLRTVTDLRGRARSAYKQIIALESATARKG